MKKIILFVCFATTLTVFQVVGAQDLSEVGVSGGMNRFLRQLAKEDARQARSVLRQIRTFMRGLKEQGLSHPKLEGIDGDNAEAISNSYVATFATYKDPRTGKIVELRGLISVYSPDGMKTNAIIRSPTAVLPSNLTNYSPPSFIRRAFEAAGRNTIRGGAR